MGQGEGRVSSLRGWGDGPNKGFLEQPQAGKIHNFPFIRFAYSYTPLVFASQKNDVDASYLDGSVVLEDAIKGTIQKGKHLP
ncbi:MAG: hypothetical protein JHC21_04160 [Thermocrinis sp.]|nr:hypothetical protein [Thermocrinis sp.]